MKPLKVAMKQPLKENTKVNQETKQKRAEFSAMTSRHMTGGWSGECNGHLARMSEVTPI